MRRDEALDRAREIICKERQNQYGAPEQSFDKIARYWSEYLQSDVDRMDVACMMILLKIARGTTKLDNFLDIIGYGACAASFIPDLDLTEDIDFNEIQGTKQ